MSRMVEILGVINYYELVKLTIDSSEKTLTFESESRETETIPLYSKKAFELISNQWLKVGWNEKHPYTFTWAGIPIIQESEDIVRLQEVIWNIKPDVIIETGVAHGGGLMLYASLCKAMGRGRVIGIEIEFRGDHKKQIETHDLSSFITLVEGSSVDPAVVQQVRDLIKRGETTLIILDSNHSRDHVAKELEAYCGMVTKDSYIVATDGSMEFLHDVPRGESHWIEDNPAIAAREFAKNHPEFVIEEPILRFNESALTKSITHWNDAWLRRVS
jgi:cephalosporin hydroxylase